MPDTWMPWPFPNEKPEFGNSKHIDAIQSWLRGVEDEESLRDFEVEMEVSGTVVVSVRACNEDDAREIAEDEGFNFDEAEDIETRIVSVKDVTPA